MTEYERIQAFNHDIYLRKDNGEKIPLSKFQIAKQFFKKMLDSYDPKNPNDTRAHKLVTIAIQALIQAQAREDNPPLKKIDLENMHGEPAWVVSTSHNGMWGIVDAQHQEVLYPQGEMCDAWFCGTYIFRYKKLIMDIKVADAKNDGV